MTKQSKAASAEQEGQALPEVGATEAAAPAAPEQPQKRCAVVYVGPSLPRGQLTHNSVFRAGELPQHVQALAEKHAAIKSLIVPVTRLAVVQQKLDDSGSVEASKVREIKAIFAKGEG